VRASLTVSGGVGIDICRWSFMHPVFVRTWPLVLAVVWCGVPWVLVVDWMGWYRRVPEVEIGHPCPWRLLGIGECNENPFVDIGMEVSWWWG